MSDRTPLVSICINNYNYERYVGRAIESALAQVSARTQVIVVDDGSTDDSVSVIEQYVPDITLVRQANGGHAAAMNAGFAHADGELVIFLDADDELDPSCAARAVAGAAPGVSKVHWRLRLVDGQGAAFGENPAPGAKLAEGDVMAEVVRSGWYSTVPTSGNCFSRSTLDALMPIPAAKLPMGGEAYLTLGAAFVGSIAVIDEPLTSYRVHANNSFATRGTLPVEALRRRLHHAEVLDAILPELAARFGVDIPAGTVLSHPDFRLMRLIKHRLAPNGKSRSSWREVLALMRSAIGNPGLRPRRRVLLSLAALTMPIAPVPVVEHVRDVAFAGKGIRSWRGTGGGTPAGPSPL